MLAKGAVPPYFVNAALFNISLKFSVKSNIFAEQFLPNNKIKTLIPEDT